MRENRPSGSEGGGAELNRPSLPLCVSVSVPGPRGASPLQVDALRPVAERNCVAARRGGKQREANDQSVMQVNSMRPERVASLQAEGEAQTDRLVSAAWDAEG